MKTLYKKQPLLPLVWIFILIILWASLTLFFNKTPFKNEVTQFFPLQDNIESLYLKNRLVPDEHASWLMLSIQTEHAKHTLEEISQSTKTHLLNLDGIQQVLNGSEPVQSPLQQSNPPQLYPYRYLLTDFNPSLLNEQIQQRWQEYQLGFVLDRAWLLDDPSFQWAVYQNSLTPSQALPKKNGVWFNEPTKSVLLLIQADNQASVLSNVHQQLEQALGKHSFNLSGSDWIAQQAQQQIKQEINLITSLALGMIFLALFIAFRSAKLIFLSSLPLLGAFSVGVLSTITLFGSMQLMTLALGAILLGVAIDYPIHLISAYQSKARSSIKKIWSTVQLGAFTSAFGFLTLWWIDIEGLQQMAIFASTGLVAAILITQALKPYLARHYLLETLSTDSKVNVSEPTNSNAITITHSPLKNLSYLLVGLSVVATILLLKPIQWQDDIASLSPVSDKLIQTDRQLRTLFEYQEMGKQLLLPANDIESLLQQQEALISRLDILKTSGAIQQYQLLAHALPSQKLQAQRQQALLPYAEVTNVIKLAVKDTRFKASHFTPFQDSLEQSRHLPLMTFEHFINAESTAAQFAKQHVLVLPNQVIGVITLSGVKSDKLIQNFVQEHPQQGLIYFNQRAFIAEQIREIRIGLFQILGVIFVVLSLIIWIRFRAIQAVLTILSPIALALGLTLALFSLLGVSLSIFHLMSLMLVAAIGIDYSLLFAQGAADKENPQVWTHSIHVAFLTTLGSFGILSLSNLALLNAIGLTVLIGVGFTYGLAYFWSKSLTRRP